MATTTLMENKSGKRFYKISISRGYGKAAYSTRWYVPDGWSNRAIQAGLKKAVHEFQTQIDNGEIKTRKEKKDLEEQQRAEEQKIQTLKQFAEAVYMPELTVTCSENTRDSFQSALDHHIYPALGNIKMPDITPAQIIAMLLSLQSEKHLKYSSVIKIYTVINLVFKKAYRNGMIEKNPMFFVDRPKKPKSESGDTTVKAFSEEELNHIKSCLQNEPLKWKLYFMIMMDCGCREGELCGVQWQDVDYEDASIRINCNIGYTQKAGIFVTTPKSSKSRKVYLSDTTMRLLKEYQLGDNAEENNIVKIPKTNGFIFTQEDGVTPMHPQSPCRWLSKFAKKYGIQDCHPHKLRHSFASVAIANGADICSVSAVLGHADATTTLKIYAHADEEAKKRASAVFRNALSTASKEKAE